LWKNKQLERGTVRENVASVGEKGTGAMLKIDEKEVCGHLDKLVRESVKETSRFIKAPPPMLRTRRFSEHSVERQDTLAGSYSRKLQTRVGEVDLKVPRLRTLPFETQIIERYKRRESSVEEALIKMCLAGVSVRRVEDVTEALWGTRVSAATVSSLNKQIYGKIEEWRNRPIEGEHPYVWLDGIYLKRSRGGEETSRSIEAPPPMLRTRRKVRAGTRSHGAVFCVI